MRPQHIQMAQAVRLELAAEVLVHHLVHAAHQQAGLLEVRQHHALWVVVVVRVKHIRREN